MIKNASLSVLLIAVAVSGCSKNEPSTAETSYPESSGAETVATAEPEPAATDPALTETSETHPGPVGAGVDPVSPAREPGGMAKAADLSDAQIALITETVDTGEIEQAKIAQTKAKNASVKKFAKHMVTQHTKAKKDGAKIAKQSELAPEASPVGDELKRKGDETLETLKSTERTTFDRTYMDSQVTQHQEVLNLIDQQLMPSAESPELKSQLEKARTMVDSHLTEAKTIQAELNGADQTQASAE